MDKRLIATLCCMNSKPHSPFINTQLQLGAARCDEGGNRFNGFHAATPTLSATEEQRGLHTRPLGQTVETVLRPHGAFLTQLKLGVNERGDRTDAGVCNMNTITSSGDHL